VRVAIGFDAEPHAFPVDHHAVVAANKLAAKGEVRGCDRRVAEVDAPNGLALGFCKDHDPSCYGADCTIEATRDWVAQGCILYRKPDRCANAHPSGKDAYFP